ncbi:14141_t:CDS:2, partial [Racocetra persica]
RSYKNQRGLNQYETIVYSNYNIPRANIILQSPKAISEFKKTLIFLIQNKLKKWENIKRYSPNRRWYYCVFAEKEAYDRLSNILEDS